jgi:hypothetical protein
MPGFARHKDIIEECYTNGKMKYNSFRKVPAITTTQGIWFDVSMAPGNPKPNYYATAELTSATLDGTYGLFHGGTVSPDKKFLHKFNIASLGAVTPATFYIMDYLLYYPLVDMDSTDEQFMNNTVTLPRYEDGAGVQIMVVATNPYVGGAIFNINYTNQDGVSGRQSLPVTSNTLANLGNLITSGTLSTSSGPFVPLMAGDTGVRSVESITFQSPNGGLAVIVLVKPIAVITTRETTAFNETDFAYDFPSLPQIKDGAYLNMICMPNGNAAAVPIVGEITTIWG